MSIDHKKEEALATLRRLKVVIRLYIPEVWNGEKSNWEGGSHYLSEEKAQESAEFGRQDFGERARVWCKEVPLTPEGILSLISGYLPLFPTQECDRRGKWKKLPRPLTDVLVSPVESDHRQEIIRLQEQVAEAHRYLGGCNGETCDACLAVQTRGEAA